MKLEVREVVTTTSIECNADELRQSTSLSDGLTNTLRRLFNGPSVTSSIEEDEEDEDQAD